MSVVLRYFLTFFSILTWCAINAQTYDGVKGHSVYHKQDKSFVTPDLRGKHSISTGFIVGHNSPFVGSPNTGLHLGYNYLILAQKKKVKKKRDKIKTRTIIRSSFGIHADIFGGGDLLITAKYFTHLLKFKGLLNSYYFFSEYGLGVHKLPTIMEDDQLKFNFSLEIMRMRLYKLPLYFHLTTNYDLSNNFLDADRKNIGIMGGFRLYFYKNKYR